MFFLSLCTHVSEISVVLALQVLHDGVMFQLWIRKAQSLSLHALRGICYTVICHRPCIPYFQTLSVHVIDICHMSCCKLCVDVFLVISGRISQFNSPGATPFLLMFLGHRRTAVVPPTKMAKIALALANSSLCLCVALATSYFWQVF